MGAECGNPYLHPYPAIPRNNRLFLYPFIIIEWFRCLPLEGMVMQIHSTVEGGWNRPSRGIFTNYFKKVRRDGKINDCSSSNVGGPNSCY